VSRATFFGGGKFGRTALLQRGNSTPPEPETAYTGLEACYNLHDASGADPWVDQHLGGIHLSAAGMVGGGLGYRYRAAKPGSTTGERLYSTSSIFNPGESDFHLSCLLRVASGGSGMAYVLGLGDNQSANEAAHGWSLRIIHSGSTWTAIYNTNKTDGTNGAGDFEVALAYDTWYWIELGVRTDQSTTFLNATPAGTAPGALGGGSGYSSIASLPGAEFSVGASTATANDSGGFEIEALQIRSHVPSLAIRQQIAGSVYRELATGVADTFAIYQTAGKVAAWYPLDETSGNRADALGGVGLAEDLANPGLNPFIPAVSGVAGNAAHFARNNNASPGVLWRDRWNFQGSFAFLFWANKNTVDELDGVLGEADSSFVQRSFYMYYRSTAQSSPRTYQWVVNDTTNSSVGVFSPEVVPNTWELVCCWYDAEAGEIGLSKNLGAAATAAFSGPINAIPGARFGLGARSGFGGAPFDGFIDEFAVLQAAPSPSLIAQLYNDGSGLAYPGS